MEEFSPGDFPDAADKANSYVLVVDSDTENLMFMSMILQRINLPVCTVLGVGHALETIATAMPSLIITELHLKGLSGHDLMQRIKQDPRTSSVPIIVMTRELTPEVEKQCLQAGAIACLEKPIQSDALCQAIYQVIEPRSRRANIRIPTRLAVTVNERPLDCVEDECATNLSADGMYIRMLQSYPVHARVLVQLNLHGQIVTAEARVVFCQPSSEGPAGMQGIGLQFLSTSPQGRELIRRFINNEVDHGLAPDLD
jgi:CheY-like chemotaxis protein